MSAYENYKWSMKESERDEALLKRNTITKPLSPRKKKIIRSKMLSKLPLNLKSWWNCLTPETQDKIVVRFNERRFHFTSIEAFWKSMVSWYEVDPSEIRKYRIKELTDEN